MEFLLSRVWWDGFIFDFVSTLTYDNILPIGSPITPASLGDNNNNDMLETPTEAGVANKKPPLSRDQSKDNDTTSPEPVGAVAVLPGKIIYSIRLLQDHCNIKVWSLLEIYIFPCSRHH